MYPSYLLSRRLLCWVAAAGWTALAGAQGISTDRLARITPRMQEFVDRQEIAGAVTMVLHQGKVVHQGAVGYRRLEDKQPMMPDTIFQVMSMTKPITAVGVMMLVEEGRLALTDNVEKHLPEFRGQKMLVSRNPDGTMVLRNPARPITVRDLLTHTSGMAGNPPEGIKEQTTRMDRPLSEAVAIYSQQPLEFEPGTRWQYSNNGIATLGRLIEVASKQPYEQFLQQRLFTPLGMPDSFFFPPADKTDRIAWVYRKEGEQLVPAGGGILGGDSRQYRKGARYPAPEWGLFSTAPDLAKLYTMLVNGGMAGGKRYLSRASLELMRMVHTGDIKAGFLGGTGYGLAFEVIKEPQGMLNMFAADEFGHGGAFGTQGWMSPKQQLVRILMIQRANGMNDVRNAFMAMSLSALE